MVLDRTHYYRAIVHALGSCSMDELRVLWRVMEGIERGRAVYGPLGISHERRSFAVEAGQECRDLLFYLAAEFVASHDTERDFKRIEARFAVDRGLDELRDAETITTPRPDIEMGADE